RWIIIVAGIAVHPYRVKLNSALWIRRIERLRRRVGNSAKIREIVGRKYRPAGLVHPMHQIGLRTKIVLELQRDQRKMAYPRRLDPQETTHIGFAETINRLHGIAHQKQTSPITRLPTRG